MLGVSKISLQNLNLPKPPKGQSSRAIDTQTPLANGTLRLQDFNRDISLARACQLGPSFTAAFKNAKNSHIGYLGANYKGDKITFRVHSTYADKMELQIAQKDHDIKYWEPLEKSQEKKFAIQTFEMKKNGNVFEFAPDEKIKEGSLYRYKITKANGEVSYAKDPRSFYQPHDTKGWSATYNNNAYKWTDDNWRSGKDERRVQHVGNPDEHGVSQGLVISEQHIGLLGGYEKAKEEIDKIADHGVCNTVYFMPVAEFFGEQNWGYEGADKFAPESSYGTPDQLKDLVNHAHKKGLNVMLDVVPGYFGPIGAVAQQFADVNDATKKNRWASGLKFEGKDGEYMRRYMLDMMINWLENFHFDGLRLDATKAIGSDAITKYFAAEIRNHPETRGAVLIPEQTGKTKKLTQPLTDNEIKNPELTLETAINDPEAAKKLGYDVQYLWDFRNTLAALCLGMDQVYDSPASIEDLAKEYEQIHRYFDEDTGHLPSPDANKGMALTFLHDEYVLYGGVRPAVAILADKLNLRKENALKAHDLMDKAPFWQSQDMLRDYLKGDNSTIKKAGFKVSDFEKAWKDAQRANRMMLSTLFMHPSHKAFSFGAEMGELTPFQFFSQYDDEEVTEKIAKRRDYDIGDESFKKSSKLYNDMKDEKFSSSVQTLTKDLSNFVKENPALQTGKFSQTIAKPMESQKTVFVHRWNNDGNDIFALINFSNEEQTYTKIPSFPDGIWVEALNTDDKKYGGEGSKNQNKNIKRDNMNVKLAPQSLTIFKRIA